MAWDMVGDGSKRGERVSWRRFSPPDPRTARAMARSKSSQRWLREHFSDPYVKKAQAEGLRSRAAYKLEELVDRDKLLKLGMVVVDLGAAPGGWSQLVRGRLQDRNGLDCGRVIALDILEMPPIAGVDFIHGDFREAESLSRLEGVLGGSQVDLVLSDMAPNMSGVDAVDQARSMYLAELARDFADQHLRVDGTFLIKLFQGAEFDDYIRDLRKRYAQVKVRKPDASRNRSSEVYALATGKRAEKK
jgi:23S rRNA (uridine2552-2'-O)-methyltransferase